MQNRGVLTFIGAVLLLLALTACLLLPWLASSTDFLNDVPDFQIKIGDHNLLRLSHTVPGQSAVDASNWLWIMAGIGEAILIAIWVFMPKNQDPGKIRIRQ